MIVQKWPKKRTGKPKPVTASQMQRFANMNLIAKYAAAPIQIAALELGSKGPLYPRDYILSTMQGGIYEIKRDDGITVYSMSQVQAMSSELDIIAQQEGMMMARGEFIWVPIKPTKANQVLAWPDPNKPPVPTEAGAAIGGHQYGAIQLTSASTSATATKGWHCFTSMDMTITHAMPRVGEVFINDYKCMLLKINGSTIDEILAETASWHASISSFERRVEPFIDPPFIPKGTHIAVVHVRTSANDNSSSGLYGGTDVAPINIPFDEFIGFVRITKKDPQVGDSFSGQATAGPFCLDIGYKF